MIQRMRIGRQRRMMKRMKDSMRWNQKTTDWIHRRMVRSRLKMMTVMFQKTVKRVQRVKKQMVVAGRCRKKKIGSVENY